MYVCSVSMKYVGRLKSNGKVFDATKGAPFTFRLGIGEVIKGWDIGVKNMRVGDKRRLVRPPRQRARGCSRADPLCLCRSFPRTWATAPRARPAPSRPTRGWSSTLS